VVEVVGAFVLGHGLEQAADGGPELDFGACGGLAQQRLELGEQRLDRVQIRAKLCPSELASGTSKIGLRPDVRPRFDRYRA
jgi:hypothetical protein